MARIRSTLSLALIAGLALGAQAQTQIQARSTNQSSSPSLDAATPAALTGQLVAIPRAGMSADGAPRLTLVTLDGAPRTMYLDHAERRNGFTIVKGTFDDRYPITLVTDGAYVAGSIHLDTMTVMLEPTAGTAANGDPIVSLRVRDPNSDWSCDTLEAAAADADETGGPQGSAPRAVETVRVLVGWRSGIAGNFVIPDAQAMTTLIQSWIEDVNDAFDNTHVDSSVHLELAGTARLPAANDAWYTGDCLSLLAGEDDGLWDDIHTLRNTLDADLVAYLSGVDGTPTVTGTGYTPGAFTVTDFYRGDSETLAHELGHNFGCSHDPDNDPSPYLPYGRGYVFLRFTSGGGLLPSRTIMAYGGNAPTWTYSNPDIFYRDFFGNYTVAGGSATNDNARVIRERAGLTAANRPAGGFSCAGVSGAGSTQLIWDLTGSTPSALRDLNHDHKSDRCQLDGFTDLNNNGILDETEDGSEPYVIPQRFNTSEFGSLFGLPQPPRLGTISVPASTVPPRGSVTVTMHARGDLNATSEYITVSFDGYDYRFFGDSADSYDPVDECSKMHTDTVTISHSRWMSMIADGSIDIFFQPSASVEEIVCGSRELGSWASIEFSYAIDPLPSWDRDLDGIPNYLDGCPDDPAKGDPGQCGCGVPDIDSDGDGVADCVDQCPADPNKTDPGVCGCGEVDVDVDGDGVCDPCPADFNGDGLADLTDITTFVSAFVGGDPLADLNGDGLFDLADVLGFVGVFQLGCP
ncbi:MAG: hypothetical protein H6810_01975 [Phycisphaeraceae bacterium]|nr:MAG: hypothetical protein H6810_01975 [Phycisphaeraceae bacterium]